MYYSVYMTALIIVAAFSPLLLYIAAMRFAYKTITLSAALKSVFAGLAAIIPALIAQYFLTPARGGAGPLSIIFGAFISAALIEEAVKFLMCAVLRADFRKQSAKKNAEIIKNAAQEISYKSEYICSCAAAGLTFGCFETALYGFTNPAVLPARVFSAVLLHGACAAAHGECLASRARKIGASVSAWMLHGFYNAFLLVGGAFSIFAYAADAFLIIRAAMYISAALKTRNRPRE